MMFYKVSNLTDIEPSNASWPRRPYCIVDVFWRVGSKYHIKIHPDATLDGLVDIKLSFPSLLAEAGSVLQRCGGLLIQLSQVLSKPTITFVYHHLLAQYDTFDM
jgi:hypothetical protein